MGSLALPDDLPVPLDDGACDHLANTPFPSLSLRTTSSSSDPVDPSTLPGTTVLFFYPATAKPGSKVPPEWDAIPGARGCTPQMCTFRDRMGELKGAGVDHVFGVSTQAVEEQGEARERLGLPYELLNDSEYKLVESLGLPTLEWEGKRLVKRMSLIVRDGVVVKCHYPVFPSDKNVEMVVEWLRNN